MLLGDDVVVIGAGQAAYSTATTLRERGFSGRITIVGDEPHAPYQRPPLSKGYMAVPGADAVVPFSPEAELAAQDITLVTGSRATRIDRRDRRVELSTGPTLPYHRLVLSTGARNREPFGRIKGVHSLRSAAEAEAIKQALSVTDRVVVLGAGFLGLELAAAASAQGLDVLVIEALGRAFVRNASEDMARHVTERHQDNGVRFAFNTRIRGLVTPNGRLAGIELDSGEAIACTTLVVSVGVIPNEELAAEAGLDIGNGILVSAGLETSDPTIYAIGDCARFPHWLDNSLLRLESVQNAVDQGEFIAARMTGAAGAYRAVPWFWTDQHGLKLQIAGLRAEGDTAIRLAAAKGDGFSMIFFRQGRLVSVESINAPGHHAKARRYLAAGATAPSPEDVASGVF